MPNSEWKNWSLLDWVHKYIDLGFTVIPVVYAGKIPTIPWKQYQKSSPSKKEMLKWFEIKDKRNVGIICGETSGKLVVLDFDRDDYFQETFFDDSKDNPLPSWKELLKKTLVVQSREGRAHVYFKIPINEVMFSKFRIEEIKLDVWGQGAQIVAPPSEHQLKGQQYKVLSETLKPMTIPSLHNKIWERIFFFCPDRREVLAEPVWNTKERHKYTGATCPCIHALLQNDAVEGTRNERLIRLCTYLLNFAMVGKEEAWEQVETWNKEKCKPSLPASELQATFNSAYNSKFSYGCNDEILITLCNTYDCKIAKGKMTPQERALGKSLLKDKQLLQKFKELTDIWIIDDVGLRYLVLWTFVSAFTGDPINVSFIGKSTIGKTYIPQMIKKLVLPVKEGWVWELGGMSARALVHEKTTFDPENKCYFVDLRKKMIMFLEPPGENTLAMLKPILSHDTMRYQYRIAEKTQRGIRTVISEIVGWPAFFMSSAIGGHANEEQSTRWITATPDTSIKKVKKVIQQMADKMINPEKYRAENYEMAKAFRCALRLIARDEYKVKILFAKLYADKFNTTGTESMRIFQMFNRLIVANTVLHCEQRKKTDEGYLEANADDFKIVLKAFKEIGTSTYFGVCNDALILYNAMCADEGKDVGKATLGYLYAEVAAVAKETFKSAIRRSTLKNVYLNKLVDAGLLERRRDDNGRNWRFRIVNRQQKGDIPIFLNEKELVKKIEKEY